VTLDESPRRKRKKRKKRDGKDVQLREKKPFLGGKNVPMCSKFPRGKEVGRFMKKEANVSRRVRGREPPQKKTPERKKRSDSRQKYVA